MSKIDHICKGCGTQQRKPYYESPSSFGVEILVWIGAIILAMVAHWIFLAAALAFSFWRFAARAPGHCSRCSGRDVIPLDSPIGRELAERAERP